MKKADYIARYGEEAYLNRRNKKKKVKYPVHASRYEIKLPEIKPEFRDYLDEISTIVRKELLKEYGKKNFNQLSIIIVECSSIKVGKRSAFIKGEIYLRNDNKEIYEWFDTAFKDVCEKIVKNFF